MSRQNVRRDPRYVSPSIRVAESGHVVWHLTAQEAEDLAYILMRARSWEQDGHNLLEAALPSFGGEDGALVDSPPPVGADTDRTPSRGPYEAPLACERLRLDPYDHRPLA